MARRPSLENGTFTITCSCSASSARPSSTIAAASSETTSALTGPLHQIADAADDVARVAVLLGEQRRVGGGAGQDAPGGDLLDLGDGPGVDEEPHVPRPFACSTATRESLASRLRRRRPVADRVEHHLHHRLSVGSRPPSSIIGMPAASRALDQIVLERPDAVERLQVALRRPRRLQRRACGSGARCACSSLTASSACTVIACSRSAGLGTSGSRCTPSITIGVRSETARSTSASIPGAMSCDLAQEARDRALPSSSGSSDSARRDVEGRVVHGGHELMREECPHDLTDLVGGDHARDAEPAGELGRDGRLADAGDAAEQDDQRPVEAARAATTGGSGPAPGLASSPGSTSSASARSSSTLHLAGAAGPSRSSISRASANERSGASPVAMIDCAISPFE